MPRRPIVLFAWEMGLGLGHSQAIRKMAARLAPHGITMVAAVRNLMAGSAFQERGLEVVQAPIWPEENLYPITGMADILANFGLGHPVKLRVMLATWTSLIDRIRPDLILADYAPGATLAARGRIPVVQSSVSFSLPPDTLDVLPALMSGPPSRIDQAVMLATVNEVLGESGRPALARLAEVFSGASQIVHTFPTLDIYAGARRRPAVGPYADRISASHGRGSGRIFAYLYGTLTRAPTIAEALRPHAHRLEIFAPDIRGGHFLPDLAAHAATVFTDIRPIAERLAGASLLVSYGSGSVTAEALAAGVPQLALPFDMEKLLTSERMAEAGVGKFVKVVGREAQITAADIGQMLDDEALADRAAAQGERHREFLKEEPLAAFERACLDALNMT